jgi:hypothetical protein
MDTPKNQNDLKVDLKNPDNETCSIFLENYKISLDFLKYEGTMLWQIFSAFFLANTLFMGFVLNYFAEKTDADINYTHILAAGTMGFLLCFPWYNTFSANTKWYNYRMKQAKKDEEKWAISQSESWYLLNKDAEKFSEHLKTANRKGAELMIGIFFGSYIIIILYAICNLMCTCCKN